MKRDAIPQFEIDDLVRQMRAGVAFDQLVAVSKTISEQWFKVNEASLYRLAGIEKPTAPVPSLEDALAAPEPSEAVVDPAPAPVVELPPPAPAPDPKHFHRNQKHRR